MKLLILYLLFALVLGLVAGPQHRRLATWPLVVGAFVVGVGFLSLRVING